MARRRHAAPLGAALAVSTALTLTGALPAGADPAPRIDLKVLVVTSGDVGTQAIAQELTNEGVPFTTVDLNSPSRPTIDANFLSGTAGGAPEAKYQAVVLPNNNPFASGSAEMAALTAYEAQFGIRQVDAYNWANPAVGLNYAGYAGTLDATTGHVSADGLSGPFDYLRGPVAFEPSTSGYSQSWGYLATPLAAGYKTLVSGTSPDGSTTGSLVGEYSHDGITELVITFAYNSLQRQYQLLAHGIVTWMTKGVHLGYNRNYLNVDIDDVLMGDDLWNTTYHCTPGDVDCPVGSNLPEQSVRMVPADVTYAVNWQQQQGFQLEMAYNGGGSEDYVADNGSDPLLTSFLASKNNFHWVNHTYNHEFLGCVQNVTVVPWQCTKDALGNTVWDSLASVSNQISQNVAWANAKGLPIDTTELISGEHSGLYILPQQPQDNPNFVLALTANGIKWTGADASRQPAQRLVGATETVPRHPLDVYYNVSTASAMVNEYNWIYTSRANGGSGLCEDNPTIMTCISPLSESTGFASYIVPMQTVNAMRDVLSNDPRPFYMHQSNLTGDRLAYSVVGDVLSTYRAAFADNTPVTQKVLAGAGQVMKDQAAWHNAVGSGSVSGYIQGNTVVIQTATGTRVPFTAPNGTLTGGSAVYGEAYAGERSAYTLSTGTLSFTLPS
ncbi:hypothetical protein GCM10010174_89440 [Kutzneria viridogrisea]|uniref:Secreted protein n=2 Tax=Kutzneria TaxID=43356 RepID=W5WMH3_9PSEU|nr:hypothetical protein [Kutzneria albida]AHI02063.1 hypothetical protein KALB_8706 [Kutzneria albida DSM 43870]MBA8929376.1 hypothetical protein [Kutzneria viridogrisea]